MLLWGNSPSAHIGPHCVGLAHLPYELFCICFLVLPPAGPCDGSLLAAKPLRPTLKICRRQIFFTLRWSRSRYKCRASDPPQAGRRSCAAQAFCPTKPCQPRNSLPPAVFQFGAPAECIPRGWTAISSCSGLTCKQFLILYSITAPEEALPAFSGAAFPFLSIILQHRQH